MVLTWLWGLDSDVVWCQRRRHRSWLYCWHLGLGAHLSAILFWSACAGWGVAVWKQQGLRRCPRLSSFLNTPCNQMLYLCHPAHSCLVFFCISPLLICYPLSLATPPFLGLLSFLLLCLGSSGLPATSVLAPPQPWAIVADPSFVCVLRLLLKIKNSPFHPLYCFLLGCLCHSIGFMSSLDIWAAPPFKGYLCCLPAPILFRRGINNFTETFIERLIAGVSHGSVVVKDML